MGWKIHWSKWHPDRLPTPADPSQPTGKVAFLRWRGLDVPAILALPVLLFIPWLLLILLLIRDHLPGVICLTLAFWLLGPVIGLGIPQFSRSQTRIALRREAYLSGGVWGILTGATFLISGMVAFGPDPAVRSFALLIGMGLIVFGADSCASGSWRWASLPAGGKDARACVAAGIR